MNNGFEIKTMRMIKLSIIIPTLYQKADDWETYYNKIIKQLKKIKIKKEIITIEWKLVNEAWNEWVKKAKWEHILIINDDIDIDQETIDKMISANNLYKVVCPYFTRLDDKHNIYSNNGKNIMGFCFMIRKEVINDFFPIPDSLKLRFWDNWIYQKANRRFWTIWLIHHYESRTLFDPIRKQEVDKIIEQDKIEWALICKQYKR